jgi:hypothetical protein
LAAFDHVETMIAEVNPHFSGRKLKQSVESMSAWTAALVSQVNRSDKTQDAGPIHYAEAVVW